MPVLNVENESARSHCDVIPSNVGRLTLGLFDIRQNEFRLVCAVHFNTRIVYTLKFMTHQEYQKGDWKDEL
jgi:mRNA-degrading endonuclease HigB of HigAB toxin-antitoxin module